ncbi:MAG: epimerase [Chloroflexi bacterium RBG_16_56_8]|nr:MAG: epimerase [Chloroflexi bacterium RBG_16_56_8]
MKYFVTGATGFVGNAVVRQLTAAGHSVQAVVRDPEKAKELAKPGVKLFAGDVTEKESLRAGMSGVNGIFHIAGWYKIGTRDKSGGERVNIQGTHNVLELMKELGIRKGVYTSTLAVYSDTHGQLVEESYHFNGRHLSEYDRTKAVAHDIAVKMINEGLPLTIVLPGIVYGPGDTSSLRTNLIDYLKRRLPIIPRRTAFCFAHVEDVARGHLLAMEKGRIGEIYNINGEPATLEDMFKLAREITGVPLPPTTSPGMIAFSSKVMGLLEKVLPIPESFTSEGLRVVAGVTYLGDNSKARRELGYDPRPLREGLKQTLEHEMSLLVS